LLNQLNKNGYTCSDVTMTSICAGQAENLYLLNPLFSSSKLNATEVT